MDLLSLVLIGVSLAMDSFSVTIAKCMANPDLRFKEKIWMPVLFGLFQGLMPLLGYFLGIHFAQAIAAVDHWIAFFLLAFIGTNMIRESLHPEDVSSSYDLKTLLVLSIATSIDAMAVGLSFSLMNVNIWLAGLIITVVTSLICVLGLFIGKKGGEFFRDRAGFVGGCILWFIGLRILIEHLFFS